MIDPVFVDAQGHKAAAERSNARPRIRDRRAAVVGHIETEIVAQEITFPEVLVIDTALQAGALTMNNAMRQRAALTLSAKRPLADAVSEFVMGLLLPAA